MGGEQLRFVAFISDKEVKPEELGGKGWGLVKMLRAGAPVPPAFVVTSSAFRYFMEKTGLKDTVLKILSQERKGPEDYQRVSAEIRALIEKEQMPPEIAEAILSAFDTLRDQVGDPNLLVAVRSSATAEDLADSSFAGQMETYLNVSRERILNAVKRCWSSLFTPRVIFYRDERGFDHVEASMGVIIQAMVQAKAAGVLFTIHPVTGDPDKIVIESSWGLGESVVSGSVTPDSFVVDKQTLEIVDRKIAKKTRMRVRDPMTGETKEVEVPPEKQEQPSLTDDEIRRLAEIAIQLEKVEGRALDIEWAIDERLSFPESVFIVQMRPETVWSQRAAKPEKPERVPASAARVVVKGLPAAPGFHIGRAKIAFSPEEASKLMEKGDILVTKMTNPDWVPYMKIAGAIVTDEGGMTCHAAIVSRELGIPCIVGASNATEVLTTGETYTVDASTGVVYEGAVELEKPKKPEAEMVVTIGREPVPVTATKIYMNLGVPEKIEEYRHLPFDGIGLMRIEFIISDYVGDHPLYLIETGHPEKFVDRLAEGIMMVAKAIYPRPVVVRFSDFKTNEYRQLKGGEKYEPEERNPMIGWRGVSRYISPQYEKAFRLECAAIRKVREEYGLKNVWVMLPFVRTTWETEACLQLMEEEGLARGRDFKVWLMAEVPSIIFLADEFCRYCDGFSIGSNDLTQLILGTDRDSEILPRIDPRYFDERDPAVLRAIAHLIRVAHKHGRTVSICGQAPSVYPEFTEFLVRQGIDSISVNPDVVVSTRRLVAAIEQKILLEGLRRSELRTGESHRRVRAQGTVESGEYVWSLE